MLAQNGRCRRARRDGQVGGRGDERSGGCRGYVRRGARRASGGRQKPHMSKNRKASSQTYYGPGGVCGRGLGVTGINPVPVLAAGGCEAA